MDYDVNYATDLDITCEQASNCCGIVAMEEFPYPQKRLTASDVLALHRRMERSLAGYTQKAILIAMLVTEQNTYLSAPLKSFGFKLKEKGVNATGNVIYLYTKSLNPTPKARRSRPLKAKRRFA